MNVKTMRLVALAGAVSVATMVAACSGDDGNGGGGRPKPGSVDHEYDGYGGLGFPGVEPTPTVTPPGGPIVVTELNTPGGLPVVSTGKCLGFTLVATEPGLYFSSTTKVDVGPILNVPTLLLDGTHLRIGASATSYECFYTPLFGATGTWDVKINNGAAPIVLPAAITVLPTKLLDVGRVEQEYVWSLDMVDDPEGNAFEAPYDVDVYRVEFYNFAASHSFAHTEFFPTGTAALLPVMEFRESSHPEIITSRGGYGLVFPKRGTHYVVVRDPLGQGGPGASYELQFVTQMATGAPNNEMCATAPLLTARTYYTNYDTLENDFDPQGNSGCRDTVYNTPINAPGNDAVWRVKVPAGKQLRVSTYDDHINNTTYLLPISTLTVGTNGCPSMPTNCVAGAGKFGGGNTDTMIYDNETDTEEEFFLIHDSATIMTAGVGSFLFDVEIWD